MRKLTVQKVDTHTQGHYVYDLSLPMPERRLKRMYFPSGISTANWLGVLPQRVYMNRRSKCKVWSERQGGWFAVRIAHDEKEPV